MPLAKWSVRQSKQNTISSAHFTNTQVWLKCIHGFFCKANTSTDLPSLVLLIKHQRFARVIRRTFFQVMQCYINSCVRQRNPRSERVFSYASWEQVFHVCRSYINWLEGVHHHIYLCSSVNFRCACLWWKSAISALWMRFLNRFVGIHFPHLL